MNNLHLDYSYEELMKEFFYFVDTSGKLSMYNRFNKIIKFFQQDVFYRRERELWKDDRVKERLIMNRCYYLRKKPEELTVSDILNGFKITSLCYSYSMFNPLLAKWFFETYDINTCYDPCGGWGHRMLGATNLDMYIYNDISKEVCSNVLDMKNYFDLYNVKIYNKDACLFEPSESFESIFTCPPYKDLESYSDGTDFDPLLNNIYKIYIERDNCNYLGIVMREDMMFLTDYNKKIELKNNTSHLNHNQPHKHKEYLYIWNKHEKRLNTTRLA